MAVNKVVLASGETLIDLTATTVTADKLAVGYTALDKTGELINGAMTPGEGGGGGGGAYNAESILLDDGTQKIKIVNAEGGGGVTPEPVGGMRQEQFILDDGTQKIKIVNAEGGGGVTPEPVGGMRQEQFILGDYFSIMHAHVTAFVRIAVPDYPTYSIVFDGE